MRVRVTGGPPVVVSTVAAALATTVRTDDPGWDVSVEPAAPSGSHGDTAPPDAGDVLVVIGLGDGVPPEIDAAQSDEGTPAVVWVAGDPDGREVADAVAWGCSCVVSQRSELSDLVLGVEHASSGRSWTTPDLVESVMAYLRDPLVDNAGGLTARELEVLDHLRVGRSTRQISDDLFISEHTTKNHIRRILAKLQARSRLEAVAIAENRRILAPRRPDRRDDWRQP